MSDRVFIEPYLRATGRFSEGRDTPRAYLERRLEIVDEREDEVRAFVFLNAEKARAAADASSARWKAGRPLSPVDGMPVGIKDVFDTADMPTELGTPFHAGRRPQTDAAHVWALRRGGAVVLGKTVTSQFAIIGEGPTRNPLDLSRTPGATSAGSAAAVAAGMVPVATGSHARGSVIRPAAYCGIHAIKPSFGALNRGGSPSAAKSFDHLGVMAAGLADLWAAARLIAETVGGDPGHRPLSGPDRPAAARRPGRLAALETAGWAAADATARDAFETLLRRLSDAGVAIVRRGDDARLDAYERELANVPANWMAISAWENYWPMATYRDRDADMLPAQILKALERAEAMTADDYLASLAFRDALRARHAEICSDADALVSLSAPGVAPLYPDVGDAVFNEPSSLLGCPAINVPGLADGGLPLGVQLLGASGADHGLTGIAAWLNQFLET